MRGKWLVTLASLSILVGCGVAQPAVTPESPLMAQHMSSKHGMMGKHAKMAQAIGLSDTQRAELKAILRKYKCDTSSPDYARKEAVKNMLLQPDFDADAFADAYQDLLANRTDRVDRRVAMFAEARNLLNADQRAKAVEVLQDKGKKTYHHDGHHHRHGKLMAKLVKRLDLTDDQQAVFNYLKDALAEGREARKANRAAKHQALASFVETGDTAALKAALLAIKPVVPVTAAAAFLDSLTLEQRQKLVTMMEKKKAKWCGKDTQEERATALPATDDDDDNDDD